MMPDLSVTIDGRALPLTETVWILWAPCGCGVGALTAASRHDSEHVVATEPEAWKHFEQTARARDRRKAQGYRLELMPWDRYKAESPLAVECPHKRDRKRAARRTSK